MPIVQVNLCTMHAATAQDVRTMSIQRHLTVISLKGQETEVLFRLPGAFFQLKFIDVLFNLW
jgi:hypothetical protein